MSQFNFTACLIIVLGGILAISTMPADVQSDPAALQVSAFLLSGGLLAPVLLAGIRNPLDALRGEFVLLLGLVYWLLLDLMQAAYPLYGISSETAGYALLLIAGFAASMMIGAGMRPLRLPAIVREAVETQYSDQALFRALLICFAIGISKFVIHAGFDPANVIQGIGAGRWSAPWARGNFGGGADAVLEHTQYFGLVLPALTVMISQKTQWLRPKVLLSVVLSAIMVAFIAQGGGRRVVGVMLGAAVFTYLVSNRRLSLGNLTTGILASVGILWVLQEILRYRNVGFAVIFWGEIPDLPIAHLHVDDNFLRLAQIIDIYPDHLNYIFPQPFYHSLTLPIPRALWNGKPDGPGFDLVTYFGQSGYSLSVSLIGELYASFGTLAVVFTGFLMGRLMTTWNRVLLFSTGSSMALVYGLGVMAAFAGLRSMQAFIQMSYVLLGWLIISHFFLQRGVDTKTELRQKRPPARLRKPRPRI